MSYISREHVESALTSMASFHKDVQEIHKRHDLPLLHNPGRRNILMSSAQESFFANELKKSFTGVFSDGKTGEPDIIIGELAKELECKITSPSKSGAINLQTDYKTLAKKKALDYLYVIADRSFEKFVVLHYNNLTTDDFAVPSSSSRGKSKLIKHVAHRKCKVLWGNVQSKNERELKKLRIKLAKCSNDSITARKKILKSINYWETSPTNFIYEYKEI